MRHLQCRNGVFYFRYRLPKHFADIVGKSEIKYSLLTTSDEIAIGLIAPKLALLRRIKLMSSVSNKQILLDLFAELTDYTFIDNLTRYQRVEQGEFATAWEVVQSEIGDSLADGGHSFDPTDFGIKTPYPEDIKDKRDYQRLLSKLADAKHQRIINDESPQFEEKLEEAKSYLKKLLSSGEPVKQAVVNNPPKVLMLPHVNPSFTKPYLLSEAWKDFRAFKSHWSEKISKDNQRLYEVMLEYWGDVDVKTIDKTMIKSVISRYAAFPKGNIKPYNEMTVAEIMAIDEEDIDDEDKIASRRVRGLYTLCQSFFSRFLTSEKDIYTTSPTANVKFEFSSRVFACLSDTQVRKLKDAAIKQDGWKKWTILLAIYTGARRGDIAGLTHHSLKKDEDTDRYYLWIDSGKTAAAIRPIPVHNTLIDLGFIAFAKGSKGKLFPKVAKNPSLLTYHARELMSSVDIPLVDDKNQRFSLHSFRHTFITKVQECGVSTSLFQTVVGHAKTQLGISNRYTHEFKVKSLFCVVDAITDW